MLQFISEILESILLKFFHRMIGANLMKLTERRRPMRPARKERKKVTAQALKDNELKILVSITRALYVPTRVTSSGYVMTSFTTLFLFAYSFKLVLNFSIFNVKIQQINSWKIFTFCGYFYIFNSYLDIFFCREQSLI